MSRYYDPVTHRFINADGYFQSGNDILDANMNAYCKNNPINLSDATGEHSACGDPTCTRCNSSRRTFINSHVDWYNRVTGNDIAGVNDYGEFLPKRNVYQEYRNEKVDMISNVVGNTTFELIGKTNPVLSVAINAIEAPCKIVNHLQDPYLTNKQKGLMIAYEGAAVAGAIAITLLIAAVPFCPIAAFGIGVVASMAYGAVADAGRDYFYNDCINTNKRKWEIQ